MASAAYLLLEQGNYGAVALRSLRDRAITIWIFPLPNHQSE